nr:PREDICTED: uncharacterized protein LOC105664180 [Megachile rotundata]XP_012152979.1 PREDICTED: uncharacterized protein LOC105664180 [Megachile rotundata]
MDIIQIKSNKLDRITSSTEKCKCNCIEENMQNLKNCITIEKAAEANYTNVNQLKGDVANSFYNSLCICKTKYEETCEEHDVYYTNEIHKMHRLTPINEQNEDCRDSLTDLCYHGCKNGCSANVPTPQEVSEKVFKENWLQKLEDIRQKETVLRNKEISLQNRERALFKKEREIQIMECFWKQKLRQLDLYFKENKDLQHLLKECSLQKDNLESISNTDSTEREKEESCFNDNSTERLNGIDISKRNFCTQNVPMQHVSCNQTEQLEKHTDNTGIICKDSHQEKSNTLNSSCCPVNTSTMKKVKNRSSLRNSIATKSTYSKSTYKSNNKAKRSSKIDYSDLDTTLSADIGDSSFVQTAQKFNPEMYRKPYIFTRSASERHIKHVNNKSSLNLETQNLNNPDEKSEALIGIEQDKVLERVTKNIVASRDKSTKFQHYGYMDQNIDSTNKMCRIENEKRYSYLNLETGNKLCSCRNSNKDLKERPVSWNEETNEWLQKKRKAYNMMIKKSRTENKENLECNAKVSSKSEKVVKKKDIKNRLFTIFR